MRVVEGIRLPVIGTPYASEWFEIEITELDLREASLYTERLEDRIRIAKKLARIQITMFELRMGAISKNEAVERIGRIKGRGKSGSVNDSDSKPTD